MGTRIIEKSKQGMELFESVRAQEIRFAMSTIALLHSSANEFQ